MNYLLYDTALNGPYTFMLLQQAYPVCQSLFKGTKDESLSDAAPWLFEADELLFEKIKGPLVSLKAVIIIQSGESLEKLCMHFKNFIYEKIDGRENYFRFWDARVLNKFFLAGPTEKGAELFEDIASFSFIDEDNAGIRLTMLHRKVQKKLISQNELFGNIESPAEPAQQPVVKDITENTKNRIVGRRQSHAEDFFMMNNNAFHNWYQNLSKRL